MGLSNQEYEIIGQFFLDNNIETDGPAGEKNGQFFGAVLTSPVTKEKVQAAFEKVKKELVFVNSTQADYNRTVANFSDYDRDFIAAKIGSYGYDITEHLLHNWNLVAKEFLRRGYQHQVNNDTFRIVIGNLAAGPNGDLLRTKPQPSKFNAAKTVEELKNAPKKEANRDELIYTSRGEHPDSWVKSLSPELRAHREANARAMAQAEEAKHKVQPQASDSDYWKTRVDQYLSSVPENLIREYLQQSFSQPRNGSWAFTWRVLDNTYNRIKNSGGLATYLASQAEKA